MKLDSRDKYCRLKQFVAALKASKDIEPFLETEEIAKFGIYDFCYINKNPMNFMTIDKKIRESKYDHLQEFTADLRQIFVSVSDFCFSEDPLQSICEAFIVKIDEFQAQFLLEFQYTTFLSLSKLKIDENSDKASEPEVQLKKEKKVWKEKKITKPKAPEKLQKYLEVPTSLTQKLHVLFLLRSNENNQAYFRQVGTHFRCGQETDNEYVITISDKNPYWRYLISEDK